MTDLDSLLHAIKQNPEDDARRLVFADWLEEHPEADPDRSRQRRTDDEPSQALAWAAAIRRQVAFARSAPSDAVHWESLEYDWERERPKMAVELLLPTALTSMTTWQRGFPDGIDSAFKELATVWDEVVSARAPFYRFNIAGVESHLAEFVRLAGLSIIRQLTLRHSVFTEADALTLAAPEGLANVTSLDGILSGLRLPAAATLFSSPLFTGLKSLTLLLRHNDPRVYGTLASSPAAPTLERVDLGMWSESLEAMVGEAFVTSPRLARLRELHQFHCHGDGWLRAITRGALPALTSIDLTALPEYTPPVLDAIREFLRSTRFRALTHLQVDDGVPAETWQDFPEDVGPPGLVLEYRGEEPAARIAFLNSPALARCISLSLYVPTPADEVLLVLAHSPHARHLRSLEIQGCDWTGGGQVNVTTVQALAQSPHLADLVNLEFSHDLREGGLHALMKASFAASLRRLYITASMCPCPRQVYQLLANPDIFPKMRELTLPRPDGVTDEEREGVWDALQHRFRRIVIG